MYERESFRIRFGERLGDFRLYSYRTGERLSGEGIKKAIESSKGDIRSRFIIAASKDVIYLLDAKRLTIDLKERTIEGGKIRELEANRTKDLTTPNRELGGKTPLEIMETPGGEASLQMKIMPEGVATAKSLLPLLLLRGRLEARRSVEGTAFSERFSRIMDIADSIVNDPSFAGRAAKGFEFKSSSGYRVKEDEARIAMAIVLDLQNRVMTAERKKEKPLYDSSSGGVNYSTLSGVVKDSFNFAQQMCLLAKAPEGEGSKLGRDLQGFANGVEAASRGGEKADVAVKEAAVSGGGKVLAFEGEGSTALLSGVIAGSSKASAAIDARGTGLNVAFSTAFSEQASQKTLNVLFCLILGQAVPNPAANLNFSGRVADGSIFSIQNLRINVEELMGQLREIESIRSLADLRASGALRDLVQKFDLMAKLQMMLRSSTSERAEVLIEKMMAEALNKILEELSKSQQLLRKVKVLRQDVERARRSIEEKQLMLTMSRASAKAGEKLDDQARRRVEEIDPNARRKGRGGGGKDEGGGENDEAAPIQVTYNGPAWAEEINGEPNIVVHTLKSGKNADGTVSSITLESMREDLERAVRGTFYGGMGVMEMKVGTDATETIDVEFALRPSMMRIEGEVQDYVRSVMVYLTRLDTYRIRLKGEGADVTYRITAKDDSRKEIGVEIISDFTPGSIDASSAAAARTIINFLADYPGYTATIRAHDLELLINAYDYLRSLKVNGFDLKRVQFGNSSVGGERMGRILQTLKDGLNISDPTRWVEQAALTFRIGKVNPIQLDKVAVEVVLPQGAEHPQRIKAEKISNDEAASGASANAYAAQLVRSRLREYTYWSHSSADVPRNVAGIEIDPKQRKLKARQILAELKDLHAKFSDQIGTGLKAELEEVLGSEGFKI